MTKGKLRTSSSKPDHYSIIESHNNGHTMDELCSKYGLKRSTINRIIKNYEHSGLSLVIKTKGSKPKLTKDQLSKVFCYYNSSPRTLMDIQKFIYYMFGVTVSKNTVSNYLKRARDLNPGLLFDIDYPNNYIKSQKPISDEEISPTQSTETHDSITSMMECSLITDDTESEFSFNSE